MGRRQRKRERAGDAAPAGQVATSDYTDAEGNVLTLRNTVSAGTAAKLRELDTVPAASSEDRWQRREELLFERLAVRWVIAELPLEDQKELLGRYRLADTATRHWIRETIEHHLREHQPELAG